MGAIGTTGALLAAGREFPPSWLVAALWLSAALILGAILIALVKRWQRREEAGPPSPTDELAHFRSLYEQGTLSAEEFERLRATLAGRIRREVKKPAPDAGAGMAPETGIQTAPPPAATETPPPPGETPPPEPPPDGVRPA